MLVLGIDAHKRTHTIVAVDERGRQKAQRTINATTADHLEVIVWAEALGDDRLWAVEDCRHLSRRLERDLLGAGERLVRVPTKMMAATRKNPAYLREIRPDRRSGCCPRCPSRARCGGSPGLAFCDQAVSAGQGFELGVAGGWSRPL